MIFLFATISKKNKKYDKQYEKHYKTYVCLGDVQHLIKTVEKDAITKREDKNTNRKFNRLCSIIR